MSINGRENLSGLDRKKERKQTNRQLCNITEIFKECIKFKNALLQKNQLMILDNDRQTDQLFVVVIIKENIVMFVI